MILVAKTRNDTPKIGVVSMDDNKPAVLPTSDMMWEYGNANRDTNNNQVTIDVMILGFNLSFTSQYATADGRFRSD